MIQPYTRVRIAFIAQQLNVPEADVEQLLIGLILDKRVAGKIDQVGQNDRPNNENFCVSYEQASQLA